MMSAPKRKMVRAWLLLVISSFASGGCLVVQEQSAEQLARSAEKAAQDAAGIAQACGGCPDATNAAAKAAQAAAKARQAASGAAKARKAAEQVYAHMGTLEELQRRIALADAALETAVRSAAAPATAESVAGVRAAAQDAFSAAGKVQHALKLLKELIVRFNTRGSAMPGIIEEALSQATYNANKASQWITSDPTAAREALELAGAKLAQVKEDLRRISEAVREEIQGDIRTLGWTGGVQPKEGDTPMQVYQALTTKLHQSEQTAREQYEEAMRHLQTAQAACPEVAYREPGGEEDPDTISGQDDSSPGGTYTPPGSGGD